MSKRTIVALSIVAIMAAAPVAVVVPASAQAATNQSTTQTDSVVTIPVNTYGQGTPGSEKLLVSKNVPNGEYKIKAKSTNQESVHPNTDMIVRSSGGEGIIEDVESEPFKEFSTGEATINITDGKVDVFVRFGADGAFSGGITITLTKIEVPVTPEEPEEPETPVTPEQPAEPEKPAETPKEPEAPAELPATGNASVIGAAAGLGSAGYLAHLWVGSKRRLSRLGR